MYPDGTWIEPEEYCYSGGKRRAYVTMPDGAKRVVLCGLPDTFFSIPARARVNKRTVKGFVSVNESRTGFIFTPYQNQA